ncbi:hypothetical protein CesoFtcFv8_000460 [Champsocephalus esox]|nr:hypothetical protein CesoFtcFv8_000460 [Champsocephalus esox]
MSPSATELTDLHRVSCQRKEWTPPVLCGKLPSGGLVFDGEIKAVFVDLHLGWLPPPVAQPTSPMPHRGRRS